MILLHASASDGSLVLWGEATPQATAKAARTSRRAAPARPPRARFGLSEGRLVEAVASAVPGFRVAAGQRQTWMAWLPSDARGALPSSPLLTDQPDEGRADRVAPWQVSALDLAAEQAASVLLAALDRPTWSPGVIVGKTLAYWATALRFAGALVARQQYLPGVRADRDGAAYWACWGPVLTGSGSSRWRGPCRTPAVP